MNDFKLIAIRPLTGCDKRFLKNLTPGHVYPFYSGYDLFDTEGHPLAGENEVGNVVINRNFPRNLYKVSTADESPLEISICAVAGKNGAGKSTLIELLFAAVYLFSIESGVMKPLLEMLDKNADVPDDTFYSDKAEIEQQLRVEIYYAFDDFVFVLKIDGKTPLGVVMSVRNLNENIIDPGPIEIDTKNIADLFFYTIAVNYSHYALNSTHMGNWINTLFHKNDGYRTPMVLSPMREEGDFSINDEMDRAQARLLSNIMIQRSIRREDRRLYKVAQKHTVNSIVFKLNERKINKQVEITSKSISGRADAANLALDLLRVLYPNDEYNVFPTVRSRMVEPILNYIYAKIVKISKTYEGFQGGYQFGEQMNHESNHVFLKLVLHEESHIAFKLRQAVNFLKLKLDDPDARLFSEAEGQSVWEYSVEELWHWMGEPAAADVSNLLPPSIFSIEFNFTTGTDIQYPMSRLSSGELHSIHAIQTVIYHLNNLASVHMSSVERVKYENINVILDEIELYYHPELQKRFVSDLLDAINQMSLNERRGIKALNIILLTHSPFILSDIPKQNLLLLKINEETNMTETVLSDIQTFGGNINEILTDSFFLDDTHIGDFADQKIVELIKAIKSREYVTDSDRQLVSMIGDDYLKANMLEFIEGYNG